MTIYFINTKPLAIWMTKHWTRIFHQKYWNMQRNDLKITHFTFEVSWIGARLVQSIVNRSRPSNCSRPNCFLDSKCTKIVLCNMTKLVSLVVLKLFAFFQELRRIFWTCYAVIDALCSAALYSLTCRWQSASFSGPVQLEKNTKFWTNIQFDIIPIYTILVHPTKCVDTSQNVSLSVAGNFYHSPLHNRPSPMWSNPVEYK